MEEKQSVFMIQDSSAGSYCWKCDWLFVQSFVAKMWQSGVSTKEEHVILLKARLKLCHYFLNAFSNGARSNLNENLCVCIDDSDTPTWGTVWREL